MTTYGNSVDRWRIILYDAVEPFVQEIGGWGSRIILIFSGAGQVAIGLLLGLLVLFLAHQATLWLSQDPVLAFHLARRFFSICASIWDTGTVIWGAGVDVSVLAIPAWNSASLYAIQPLVFTTIEVMYLAFAHRPYEGIIDESVLPWEGHNCPKDGSVGIEARWCGLASSYSEKLGFSREESGFVSNNSLLLSAQASRRLSEYVGEPLIGSLDVTEMTDALQGVFAAFILVGATASDLFFHVAFEVFSVLFDVIFSFVIQIMESVAGAAEMLFSSEAFADILKWGVDLILVLLLDVAIPLMFSMMDLIFCVLDLFKPDGWADQLLCISQRCWQPGSDVSTDTYHLFSSIPIVAHKVESIFEKLINKGTGRRYSGKTSGGVGAPNLGDSGHGTPQAIACAACFNCKVSRVSLTQMFD